MAPKKSSVSFVKASELEAFHKAVCSVLQKTLSHQVEMKPTINGWKSLMASTDARVSFQMYPKRSEFHETAENDLGHRCPVLPFPNISKVFPTWIFCWDEWIKSDVDQYDLIAFSICFFGGGGQKKTQLLRAEWANPARQGSLAAQPHWHIDPNLLDLDFWNGKPSEVAKIETTNMPLQELPIPGGNLVTPAFWSLQKLHLGMGGWHHGVNSPTCWQHPLDFSDRNELLKWLSKTLVYVSSEIGKASVSS